MLKITQFIILSFIFVNLISCTKETCNDPFALNLGADNACVYSRATFYGATSLYYDSQLNFYQVVGIQVKVNGKSIGTITDFYVPSDCSSSGTVPFTFTSGSRIDWEATIRLDNGQTVVNTGSAEPSPDAVCLRIRVN